MKLNIEVLQLRVDSLQSLANVQKECSSTDHYIHMIDCLKQELYEEKQKRLKMEYDLKILKDKLLNVGGHIKINNELKNDVFDNNIFTLGELHAPEEICVDDSLENLHTFAKPAGQKQLKNLIEIFKLTANRKMII